MSFCPNCKSEYINGRTNCADCGALLVDSLDELNEQINADNSIDNANNDDTQKSETYIPTYVSQKDKYKDYKSTGYTFLLLGCAGLIVITLNLFNIISIFNTKGASAILFYTVMYTMFVIFVFVAVNSFANASKYKAASVLEDKLLADIDEFVQKNITSDLFDNLAIDSDEEMYFKKTEIIRSMINEAFPDIDRSLLEKTVDEAYEKITDNK